MTKLLSPPENQYASTLQTASQLIVNEPVKAYDLIDTIPVSDLPAARDQALAAADVADRSRQLYMGDGPLNLRTVADAITAKIRLITR